ncbi:MAG: hypothetical protein IPF82_08090 [Blastocatellia bacterium]|jgi:hypothetical protein|nr:hypothetical protein [Blastocatellia bacterium]
METDPFYNAVAEVAPVVVLVLVGIVCIYSVVGVPVGLTLIGVAIGMTIADYRKHHQGAQHR